MPKLTRADVNLHYELDGSGDPAVYISGFSSHSNDVLGVFLRHALPDAGYRLLAVDNRGAGQTETLAGHRATLNDMADDIAAVMDAEGISSADVLGVSMGGAIAMTLAVRHPQKVKRQVIAVSLAHAAKGRSEFILRTTRMMRDQGVPREIINRYNALYLLSEDLFHLDWLMEAFVHAPADPLTQTAQGFDVQINALENYDVRPHLPSITQPTLVVSSPDDILVPPHFQAEIAELLPNARMRHYPGGHVFMVLPQYRDSFVADVVAFWRGD